MMKRERPEPPEQALDDARRFYGVRPYDRLALTYGDGYFDLDREQTYGPEVWAEAKRLVRTADSPLR